MTSIKYEYSKDVPLIAEVDVVVLGGGPGGLGSAIMAARAGAKVLLVERYGSLGGMASIGEVQPFMPNHLVGECLDRPVFFEWVHQARSYRATGEGLELQSPDLENGEDRGINKEAVALAAEDLCQQAGVEILYHHQMADVVMQGRKIETLILLSKSGYVAVKASCFVDSTGDADLAAKAGCAFELGDKNGNTQPMTLCFKLCNVEKEKLLGWGEVDKLYKEAAKNGEVCGVKGPGWFGWIDDNTIHLNMTRIIHRDATDGISFSEAQKEGYQQVRELLEFHRKHLPGCENAILHSMGAQIGVRESRRVTGLAKIEKNVFQEAQKFPDGIARVRYMIDIHNPDGLGTNAAHMADDDWYEIPYGCLVPQDCDNLLIGCRAISADHVMHSSFRIMPPICSIGQAAGLAAAQSASTGTLPAEIDGVALRETLIQMGANL